MYAEIWKSPFDGLWYWHVRGRNHEIVTQSEGYTTKASALHGLRLIFNGPVYDR
jgi:uncharacterized protein YegP (UPF0339 family)